MTAPPRQAVVLAAGRGTRMGPLTEKTPKPLLQVGGCALIDGVVVPLAEGGIERFVFVVGYLADQVQTHLSNHPALADKRVRFVKQEKLDGTGGALRVAAPFLAPEPFVLAFGDVATPAENITNMLADFRANPCDMLMAVADVGDPSRGAAVTLGDDDRIEKMVEKPPPGTAGTPWINAGVIVLRPRILEYLGGIGESKRGEVELPDALNAALEGGAVMRAFRLKGYWSDVGTPADLEATDRWRRSAR